MRSSGPVVNTSQKRCGYVECSVLGSHLYDGASAKSPNHRSNGLKRPQGDLHRCTNSASLDGIPFNLTPSVLPNDAVSFGQLSNHHAGKTADGRQTILANSLPASHYMSVCLNPPF